MIAPTLVLHRRDMAQIPVEVSRSLAKELPRGRLVVLDGAQPTLFTEDSGAVVAMLVDFFCDGIEPAEELAPGLLEGAAGHLRASARQPQPPGTGGAAVAGRG